VELEASHVTRTFSKTAVTLTPSLCPYGLVGLFDSGFVCWPSANARSPVLSTFRPDSSTYGSFGAMCPRLYGAPLPMRVIEAVSHVTNHKDDLALPCVVAFLLRGAEFRPPRRCRRACATVRHLPHLGSLAGASRPCKLEWRKVLRRC
jgi:hypothetical protein